MDASRNVVGMSNTGKCFSNEHQPKTIMETSTANRKRRPSLPSKVVSRVIATVVSLEKRMNRQVDGSSGEARNNVAGERESGNQDPTQANESSHVLGVEKSQLNFQRMAEQFFVDSSSFAASL